jgi:Amt family ammonium transporter
MMTLPGLALFYGGLVRRKNVLSVCAQCFGITGLVAILWWLCGYGLIFGVNHGASWQAKGYSPLGDLQYACFGFTPLNHAITGDPQPQQVNSTPNGGYGYWVSQNVYAMFQLTFAIITPALITGAFADRMKFSAMLLFLSAWSLLVYAPIAHMVWEPTGWLNAAGVLDYAGGTVVHINAGIAGLASCLVLGKRLGYGREAMPPHNLTYTLIGASLLWVGWFGFNAGSAVAADGRAGMAMLATQMATGAAALGWMFAEWAVKGKPSVLGIASGAVAGLVAITPASGYVGPTAAVIIGAAAGVVCYFAATTLKHAFGYDDSLDAFGVHGIGGILGALLTGVFFSKELTGVDATVGKQVFTQLKGVLTTVVYGFAVSYVILIVLDKTLGLRVTEEQEREGLDISLHGESIE